MRRVIVFGNALNCINGNCYILKAYSKSTLYSRRKCLYVTVPENGIFL